MEDLTVFNNALVAATSSAATKPKPPAPPTPEIPLMHFGGAGKSVTLHRGRGGAALLPRSANYDIHVYEIVGDWWRVTPRNVDYWMRAIPLRAA